MNSLIRSPPQPAPLSKFDAYTTWPGGVDPTASLFNTDNQKGVAGGRRGRKASRKNSRKVNRKNSRKVNRKNSRKVNRKNNW
jgi:hypothetical protein